MAHAEKLPSGKWRVKVYIGKDKNGKRIFKSFTADSARKAERMAALYDGSDIDDVTTTMSMKEACEEYIETRKNILSPWTVTTYRKYIDTCYGDLMVYAVQKVTAQAIKNWVNEYSKDHSPKTVQSRYGFLASVLKEHRPNLRLDSVELPKKIKPNIQIPTDEQVQTASVIATDDTMKLAIALCAGLGLRRGEIVAIRWADVQGNRLHVCRAYAKSADGWKEKTPKTYAGDRYLTIPNSICELFNRLKTEQTKASDRIIPLTPDAITRRWERIAKRAGINCRFYDLRHYNASLMLSLGIPDLYAMERMGHATPNMLKTVYQHIQDEKRKEVSDIMSEKINSVLK